jgi:hypothetical protein
MSSGRFRQNVCAETLGHVHSGETNQTLVWSRPHTLGEGLPKMNDLGRTFGKQVVASVLHAARIIHPPVGTPACPSGAP